MKHWIIVMAALLLPLSACRHRTADGDEAPPPEPSAPVTVEVVNNFALPVEIYAIGSGTETRLGTVHPGMEATFVIPQSVRSTTTVELQAHAASTTRIGSSGPLLLAPGSIVDFTVTSTLFNSTAVIREP